MFWQDDFLYFYKHPPCHGLKIHLNFLLNLMLFFKKMKINKYIAMSALFSQLSCFCVMGTDDSTKQNVKRTHSQTNKNATSNSTKQKKRELKSETKQQPKQVKSGARQQPKQHPMTLRSKVENVGAEIPKTIDELTEKLNSMKLENKDKDINLKYNSSKSASIEDFIKNPKNNPSDQNMDDSSYDIQKYPSVLSLKSIDKKSDKSGQIHKTKSAPKFIEKHSNRHFIKTNSDEIAAPIRRETDGITHVAHLEDIEEIPENGVELLLDDKKIPENGVELLLDDSDNSHKNSDKIMTSDYNKKLKYYLKRLKLSTQTPFSPSPNDRVGNEKAPIQNKKTKYKYSALPEDNEYDKKEVKKNNSLGLNN
jgi:hypothetical protein